MKFSKQRELILNTILNNSVHPSADYIYETLKKDNPSLSLGTVYRNLSQLVDHGFIKKVSIPGCADRFDGHLHDHYHFVCDKCRKIYDIDLKSLNNINTSIESEFGLQITHTNISFRGICSKCKNN